MAVSAANVVVGQGGTVLYGTVGITAPTTGTGTVSAYTDVGYLDEAGVTLTVTPSVTDFNVWQSRQPVRRENQAQAISFAGNLAEWNAATVPLVFGGGAVTTGTYSFPTDTASLNEFAGVIDVVDSADAFRFVFFRANQTEATAVQFNRSNIAVLPFNFGVLAPTGGGVPVKVYTNAIA